MNTPTRKPDPFDMLLESCLVELMSMSDTDVLDGADPAVTQAAGLRMLDAANAEAGRRRLATAKAELVRQKGAKPSTTVPSVTPEEARAFLRKASNDSRFTLAARGLDEMSDEDALRLYQKAKQVQDIKDERKDDEG